MIMKFFRLSLSLHCMHVCTTFVHVRYICTIIMWCVILFATVATIIYNTG